jgi:hypothetical protein
MNPSLLGLYLIAAEARLPALSVSAPIRLLLPPPEESKTVRTMFRLYLECGSVGALAEELARQKDPIEGPYLRGRSR